jgi:hypothetical protein
MERLYRCDPDKNIPCKQKWCYRIGRNCYKTTEKQYKMSLRKRIKEFIGRKKLWMKRNSKD